MHVGSHTRVAERYLIVPCTCSAVTQRNPGPMPLSYRQPHPFGERVHVLVRMHHGAARAAIRRTATSHLASGTVPRARSSAGGDCCGTTGCAESSRQWNARLPYAGLPKVTAHPRRSSATSPGHRSSPSHWALRRKPLSVAWRSRGSPRARALELTARRPAAHCSSKRHSRQRGYLMDTRAHEAVLRQIKVAGTTFRYR